MASCRNVTSPISASARVDRGPAEGGPDRAWRRCRRCRPGPGWRSPCAGRRRRTRATIRSRSRIGLEAPTYEQPTGRNGPARPRRRPRAASAPARRPAARRAAGRPSGRLPATALSQAGSSGPATTSAGGQLARRPGTAGRANTPAAGAAHTSTSARPSSRVTGRDRVGCPKTTTRSMRWRRGRRRAAGGSGAAAFSPVRQPRAGLGQQRPAGLLGQHPSRRPGVVPGDHDGARPEPGRSRRTRAGQRGSGRVGPRRGRSGRETRRLRRRAAAGSSSCTLRWTGPVAATSSPEPTAPEVRSGPEVDGSATRAPKMPTWSVVWLAPVPRSRAGRSAVTHDQRHAGVRRLEHGRVQVRHGGARGGDAPPPGAPTRVRPSARNPAVRSSIRVCSRSRPAAAASYAAKASGALRDPGAEHDLADPARDQRGDDRAGQLGGGVAHDGRSCRTARTAASRAAQRAARSAGAASRASDSSSTTGRTTRQHPVDRQQRVDDDVVGEQLHGRQPAGVAAARAAPRPARPRRRCPTEVSSAEDTTTGSPMSSAIRRQARTPAERLHLEHGDVGGLEVAHPVGVGSPRRIDSSAAIGTSTARRTAASSSTVAHGCSTYSSPPAARSSTADRRHGGRRRPRARWRRPGPGRRGRARRAPPRAAPGRRPASARARRPSPWRCVQPPARHDRVRLLRVRPRARSR